MIIHPDKSATFTPDETRLIRQLFDHVDDETLTLLDMPNADAVRCVALGGELATGLALRDFEKAA